MNEQRLRTRLSCVAALAILLARVDAAAEPARPTTLNLAGVLRLEGVAYDASTPADLAQPASGRGTLVLAMSGLPPLPRGDVAFSNLISNAAGDVEGASLALSQPLVVPLSEAPRCALEIATGQLAFAKPGALTLTANTTLRLPFRNSDGTPVVASVTSARIAVSGGGAGEIALESVALSGKAVSEGIRFPGLRVRAAPLAYRLSWTAGALGRWTLTFPKIDVSLALPGVASETDVPIELKADAKNLTIDQDGQVTFGEASLTAGASIRPVGFPGLELTLRSGSVSMTDSIPAFRSLVADVTLPPSVAGADGKAAKVPNLSVNVTADGPIVELPSPLSKALDLRCGAFQLALGQFALDLSTSAKVAAGSPPAAIARPDWTGIWIRQGEMTLALGAASVRFSLENFTIDAGGLTGSVSGAPMSGLKIEGFTIENAKSSIQMKRNRLVAGGIEGKLAVPGLGKLDGSFAFSEKGRVAFALKASAANVLEIPNLPLKLSDLGVRLADGRLALDGTMTFDPVSEKLAAPPGIQLGAVSCAVSDFQVDGNGKIYLPSSGEIRFPRPVDMDLGLFGVQLRSLGFGASGGKIRSITFSGAGRLTVPIEGFPIGGELDFEGLTVRASTGGGALPEVEVGGLGIRAEIPGLGAITATLGVAEEVNGFSAALYGGAKLTLTCLPAEVSVSGSDGGGAALCLMVAPKERAWFVGGQVEFPGIPVFIPPAPPAVPTQVDLFKVCGFAGGFGMNVMPIAEAGVGPIVSPIEQLKHGAGSFLAQMGLLLQDATPASGKIWWGDVTLTATLNPVTIDLTGRVCFLDVGGTPRWLEPDDFSALDRRAAVYMNLDVEKGRFLVGGDADMNFPTRRDNLIGFKGEGLFRADGDGMAFYVGWKDETERIDQDRASIRFGKAVKDVLDVSGSAGLRAVASGDGVSAGMYVKLEAKINAKIDDNTRFSARMKMKGRMSLSDIGTSQFEADGDLGFSGSVTLKVFGAKVLQSDIDGSAAVTLDDDDFSLKAKITASCNGWKLKHTARVST